MQTVNRALRSLAQRRPRLSYANVMATIAVFGVLGGGAYATHTHRMGTQDLQNRAVTAPKLANNSVIPRTIRQNAVRPGKINNNAVRARHLGQQLLRGELLTPGLTLRGTFNLHDFKYSDTANAFTGTEISFGLRLPAAPEAHVLDQGDSPTAECPGGPQAPAAAPGHLCVYVAQKNNIHEAEGLLVFDNSVDPGGDPPSANRFGAGLSVRANQTITSGMFFTRGTWAVTAPE